MSTDLADALGSTFIAALGKIFRPIGHAETVLTVPPVWIRASGAEALFGVKREWLNSLVAKRKIIAKKADKLVLYKFADICAAIEEMPNVEKNVSN